MRKLMLSLCGGLLAATAAFAQPAQPAPIPKPVAPAPMPKPVAPSAPAVVAPTAPAPVVVAAPATGVGCAAPGCAPSGCDSCGKSGAAGKVFGNHKLFIGVGTATPVDCTCHAADKTFVFGSCKQFFNPGKTCNGVNLHGGRERCPLPAYAAPYGKPGHNCAPFSYLDR